MALGSSVMDPIPINHEVNQRRTCYSGASSSVDFKWSNLAMDYMERNGNFASYQQSSINGPSMYKINMEGSQMDVFGIEADGVIDVETTLLSEDDLSSTSSDEQTESNESENFSVENDFASNVQAKRMKRKKRKNSTQDIPDLGYELDNAYKILQHLMSPTYKAVNQNFIEAVTVGKGEHNNYDEIITKPMWLSKVKSKLLEGEYSNITEFVQDIRLILENCYRYHGPHHAVTKKALKMETMLEQKLALLPRDLKEKTAFEVTSSELIESAGFKGVGRHRITRLTIGDSSLILKYVSLAKAQREREAKRRLLEERKAEKEAEYQEILEWESKLLEEHVTLMKSMWELPQIGQFLFLTQKALNIPEVSQYMLERMFFIPKESLCLATIMTSLLSSPLHRSMLDQRPPMPYRIWNKRLRTKVQMWYKVFQNKGRNVIKVFETLGIESDFFVILGDTNPYENKSYHEFTIHQRVWLLKALCDYCLYNHKTIQDAIGENSLPDQRDYLLGSDRCGNTYIHFPQFCGQDLRIYREASWEEPPELLVVMPVTSPSSFTDEEAGNKDKTPTEKLNKSAENNEAIAVVEKKSDKDLPARNTKCENGDENKMEEDIINEFTPETAAPMERKADKELIGEHQNVSESKVKEDSNIKEKDSNIPEDNTPDTKEKIIEKHTEQSSETLALKSTESDGNLSETPEKEASHDKKSSCKIQPDINKFQLVVDSVESLRQLIDEFSDKSEASEYPRRKRKGRSPVKPQCEVELKENLYHLLTELEPWEAKLHQAAKRMRIRLRKEWDEAQKKQAEKETSIWDSEPEEEKPSSSTNSFHDEKSDASEAASSSSEEEEASQGDLKRKRIVKEEEKNNSDASASSDSNSHVRCLRKRKIRTDKNVNRVKNARKSTKKDKIASQFACNTDSEAQGQYYWETLRQIIVSSSKKEPVSSTLNSGDPQVTIKPDPNIPSSPAVSNDCKISTNSNVIKQTQNPCSSGGSSTSSFRRRIFTSKNKPMANEDTTYPPLSKQAVRLNSTKKPNLYSGDKKSSVVLYSAIVNAGNKVIKTFTSQPTPGKQINDKILQETNVSFLKEALKQQLNPEIEVPQKSKNMASKITCHPSNMNVLSMRGNLKKKLDNTSEFKNTADLSSSVIQQYDVLKNPSRNISYQQQQNTLSSSNVVLPTIATPGASVSVVGSGNSIHVPSQSGTILTTSAVQGQQVKFHLSTPADRTATTVQQQSIKLIPAVTQDGKKVFLQYITTQPESSAVSHTSILKSGPLQIQNKKPFETSSYLENVPSQTETLPSSLLTQQINITPNETAVNVAPSNISIPSSHVAPSNVSIPSSHVASLCTTQVAGHQATSAYPSVATANGHSIIKSHNSVISSSLPNSVSSVTKNTSTQNSKVINMSLSQFLQQNHSKFTAVPTSDGQKIILTLLPKNANLNQGSTASTVIASPTNNVSQTTLSGDLQKQISLISPYVTKTVCASSKEPPPLGPITQRKLPNEEISNINMVSNGFSQMATATNAIFSAIQPETKVPSHLQSLTYISSPTSIPNSHAINSLPSVKVSPSVASVSGIRSKVYTTPLLAEVPAKQGVSLAPCSSVTKPAQHQIISNQNSLNVQNFSLYSPSQQKTTSVTRGLNIKPPTSSPIPTQTLQALQCNPQSQNATFPKMNTVILQPSNALPTSKSSFRTPDASPVKMMILTTAPNPPPLATVSLHKETHHLLNATSQLASINSVAEKKTVKILPKQPTFSTKNEIVVQPTSFVRNILPVSQSPVAMQNEIDNKLNTLPVVATSVVGAGNFQILNQSVNATPVKGRTSLVLVNENNQVILSPQFVRQYPVLSGMTECINHNA